MIRVIYGYLWLVKVEVVQRDKIGTLDRHTIKCKDVCWRIEWLVQLQYIVTPVSEVPGSRLIISCFF